MDFIERLNSLATKVRAQKNSIQTEEATKNAFVMPFISAVLGYDVFNPLEVVPEFTADVGLKRGEKIDYAIMRDGEVQILIEAKKCGSALSLENASQLYRYFGVTNARIALLTNGIVYQFYTDLDDPNRMDSKPFLVLDLEDIDNSVVPELAKLTKESFDLGSVISAAEELKYVGQLKREIAAQFKQPGDDWVKFFTSKVYEGAFTQKVREQFTVLVDKAANQYLKDQVNARLKSALGAEGGLAESPDLPTSNTAPTVAVDDLESNPEVETTEEELDGYSIVKAIACSEVKPQRIFHRDAKSYFAILIDDNNRKSIARLHFNGRQKYLGLFDEDKVETRHPIDSLDEIYNHAEQIRATARRFA